MVAPAGRVSIRLPAGSTVMRSSAGDTPTEVGYAVAGVVELVDGSHGAGLNALSRTLFLALDRRDRAIEDIRVLAPPARRWEDIARVRARKSQGEEQVVRFDTVMPNTIAQFDDELQTIAGTLTDAMDVMAGGRRLLGRATDQVTATNAAPQPPLSDQRPAQRARRPLVVVGGTPPAHRGRVRGRRRAAAVRARGLTGRRCPAGRRSAGRDSARLPHPCGGGVGARG